MSDATGAVLDNAEQALDVIEDRLDDIETIEIVRNNPVVLTVVGVLGLAAGAAGGYFVARKLLRKHYDEVSAREIAEARTFYASVYKTNEDGTPKSPQEVLSELHGAEAAAEAVRTYQGQQAAEKLLEAGELSAEEAQDEAQIRKISETLVKKADVVEPEPETRNVFRDDNFDLAEELKYRTEDAPYILTHDEYFEGGKDYDTVSLTYYEEDDTLTDEQDKPIREIDKVIGEDHLIRFGHGSKDANVVYIRNDRLETDYEVTKSTGSYVEEVLGMLDDETNGGELRHSNRNAHLSRRREFRHGDD